MKAKNYLVSWSGGLDSTYLIWLLLMQGHSVVAVYTELENSGCKTRRELDSIDKMLPILESYNFKFKGGNKIFIKGSHSQLSLSQPLLWLNSLMYQLEDKTDIVAVGYILGDDAISYLSDFKKIFNSMLGLTICKKKPKLEFPLIKHHKKVIYESLPEKLRIHTTWCENFFGDDLCGKCVPCKKMKEYYPELYTKKIHDKSMYNLC